MSDVIKSYMWSDYNCAWCYVGIDRCDLLRSLGVEVVVLPFELLQNCPPQGISFREKYAKYAANPEMQQKLKHLEEECAAAGLPYNGTPDRIPNTRRALETAECVRRRYPDTFPAFYRSLFMALVAEGRPIDEPDVIDEVVTAVGLPAAEIRAAVEAGELREAREEARKFAVRAYVPGTPTWLIGDRHLVEGAQPRAAFERAVAEVRAQLAVS